MTGLKKPPSVLKAFALAEAKKKDNYPIGTLRLYTGKMANKDFHAHIYVKTGKAGKPWSYYATYPSKKADEILKVGAGIVVDVDGKQKVFPASPEMLNKYGQEHPFKGQLIPSIAGEGDYNLGSVADDGHVSIDPEGIKELEATIEKGKQDAAGTPPEPENDALKAAAKKAQTDDDYHKKLDAEKAKTKALDALSKQATNAITANDADTMAAIAAKAKELGADDIVQGHYDHMAASLKAVVAAKSSEPLTMTSGEVQSALQDFADNDLDKDELAAKYPEAKAYFSSLVSPEESDVGISWYDALDFASELKKDPNFTFHPLATAKLFASLGVKLKKELGIDVKTKAAKAALKDLNPPAPGTLKDQKDILAALADSNAGWTSASAAAKDNPVIPAFFKQFVVGEEGVDWEDAFYAAASFIKDPKNAFKVYSGNNPMAPAAAKIASALDLYDYSTMKLDHPEIQKAIDIYNKQQPSPITWGQSNPEIVDLFKAMVGPSSSNVGVIWSDALQVAAALKQDPDHEFPWISPEYQSLIKKIKKELGMALPVDAPLSIQSPEAKDTFSAYNDNGGDFDVVADNYPGIVKMLQMFLSPVDTAAGLKWPDVLDYAAALHKDPDFVYPAKGTAKLLAPIGAKLKKEMGISIAAPPTPAPGIPATPTTSPTPEEQGLQAMVSYLKQIGFGDAKKQADFTKSPAWMGQMASQYGKNWLSKLMQGATALGIDPSTLEPEGQAPTAPEPAKPVLPPTGLPMKSTMKNIALEYQANGKVYNKLPKKYRDWLGAYSQPLGVLPQDVAAIMAILQTTPQSAAILTGVLGGAATQIAKDMGIDMPASLVTVHAPPVGGLAMPAGGYDAGAAPQETPVAAVSPPTQFASLVTPSVPALSSMKKGASAKSLGGAGKKDFYSDAQGKKYLVKLALEKDGSAKPKPFAAIVQEVFSSVALTVRQDHIPLRVDTNAEGVMVTVQPFLDRGDPPTVEGMAPSQLTPQERADVASEHVLDWMMSQHDSYGGNLVRRKDGRVLGVDKEQAFRFFPDDKLDVDYNPNPIEPYYNQFWKAFRDGAMDFDPKVMKGTFDKIDQISDVDYTAQIERYAKAIWPSEVNKRAKFLKDALERKKNLRAEFEGFVSGLYQKKTGTPKGVFTFNGGWDPTGKAPTTAKKKNLVKVKAKEWAVNLGIKEYPYAPTEGPEKGQSDPNKIVLKVSKNDSSATQLNQFIKDTGLKPIGSVVTGAYYNIAVFDKHAYDAVEMEKELAKPIEVEPEDSSALVEIDPHKHAEMNNQELANIETAQLGPLGKRFASDSAGIEGQYMRAKRMVDASGEISYVFQFKMRPAMVATLVGGTSGSHDFPKLAYQPGPDAMAETGGNVISKTLKGLKWKNGSSEAFIYKDDYEYTFKNSVFIKVKPKKGQTAQQAFAETLDKMRPDLAKDLLRNPTEEEREVAKLARLLWAAAPQESDALKNTDYTLEKLKTKLAKHGFDDSDFAKIEERETYSGLQSHVIPGRHKKIGGGKFRFLFNGISDVGAAVSILKLGLLGISERAMMGIHLKGGSVEADIHEGAGDQVLLRAVTENGFGNNMGSHPFGGTYQAIVDPAEIDRLDCYMHSSDQFGGCSPHGSHSSAWTGRKTVEKAMDSQAKSYSSAAEIMFRKGIARSKILRIACASQGARASLIKEAKAAGIVEVNGVSIDNFVVVAGTSSEAYEKCVKPVLAKAAAKAAIK